MTWTSRTTSNPLTRNHMPRKDLPASSVPPPLVPRPAPHRKRQTNPNFQPGFIRQASHHHPHTANRRGQSTFRGLP